MTNTPTRRTNVTSQLPTSCRKVALGKLEDVLSQQLTLVGKGDFKKVEALGGELAELLRQAGGADACTCPHCLARIERINNLHTKLGLTLAAQKHQCKTKLDRLGKGKKLLRVYFNGSLTG